MSSTRVFVRLFGGACGRDGDEELLMLPPPPLTWRGVVSAMIKAVTKQSDEPDEQAIGRARVFLLPSEPSGIVAELNARALRFGVRDNDH
ncbi:hypothetical protein ATCC90586_012026 [Pythium insidiosum]|nr:hypothetical protein ATCC90586_012026 [Pythium insidiosum]